MNTTEIGKFNVESGQVYVTDPCYDPGTWCQARIPAKNGEWQAFVDIENHGLWGKRVETLLVIHADSLTEDEARYAAWERVAETIGVDSGQCGVFDLKSYRDDQSVPPVDEIKLRDEWDYIDEIYETEPWYAWVCSVTNPAGVVKGGAASSSGYGDGAYTAFAVYEGPVAVAIKVCFL